MTEDSNSSSEPEPPATTAHYKVIIAIGVMGTTEDIERFTATWIADSERRAHQINDRLFEGRLLLLPLPEETT